MARADFPSMDVATLNARLRKPHEIALIDIREAGEYGSGHALLAVNLPWSVLEVNVTRLIPRRGTTVVVQDEEGGDRAGQAVLRLQQLGYREVYLALGGVIAWRQAGYALFPGVNVLSKAFSEWLEHKAQTPSLTAETVYQWQLSGKPLLLLDGRTPEEFRQHHIPGAINCPNAELLPWLKKQSFPADLPVVITCAGRTRGIIGAQSLIDAGVPQPVAALAGGTQAWRIAGQPLLSGGETPLPPRLPPQGNRPSALDAPAIPDISRGTLTQWQADESVTTYVFDVRSREEYLAGTLPGALWVPGGQLVQTLDEYAATRGARLVVFDPAGERAQFAAWWLYQLGWSVSRCLDDGDLVIPTPREPDLSALFPDIGTLDARKARAQLTPEVQLLSADRSKPYLQRHIAGARWVNRARLAQAVERLSADKPVWVCAEQTELAHAVAWDLRTRFRIAAQVVTGDAAAWQAAGWPLVEDDASLAESERSDFLFWLHDRHSGNLQASRDYLAWEASLPAAVAREGGHGFRRLGPGGRTNEESGD
ncbi:Rhodanese-like domain-containing protein (plasmid) [Sodalis praecaptivus]|uniref:Rhodanese-like domain-containing protein n=1 Tax=Sodalis praecaptivus TaxID=1239307 RepID=W0I454_9GAMM|nr:rhodanese-like domain-containing protein [Sodalis praecaptivus]AHF79198.1 Rhodanese-like domain-containing protein [Sodalis praecaptivus]